MMNATAPGQIDALDSAYHFAIELLRREFDFIDGNEIAGVAAAYALAHWPDWVERPDEQQELIRVRDSAPVSYEDSLV